MLHELKTWPRYFERITSGQKSFELRKNDRDFQPGDAVLLREFDPDTMYFTGKQIHCRITYVMSAMDGLLKDYCIFSFEDLRYEEVPRERFYALCPNLQKALEPENRGFSCHDTIDE